MEVASDWEGALEEEMGEDGGTNMTGGDVIADSIMISHSVNSVELDNDGASA